MFKTAPPPNKGISLLQSGGASLGASTTLTATFSSLNLGDMMVICIRCPSASTITNLDGFTASIDDTELKILTKVVTDASDLSYTFTFSNSQARAYNSLRFSRCRIISDETSGNNSGSSWSVFSGTYLETPTANFLRGGMGIVFFSGYGTGATSTSVNQSYTVTSFSTTTVGYKWHTDNETVSVRCTFNGTPSSGIRGARLILRRLA